MNQVIILLLTGLLIACNNSKQENVIISKNKIQRQVKMEDWSNPIFINGSSFGDILNTAFRLGDFDLLYNLTDRKSKLQYSKGQIVNFYKHSGLGFKMSLISISHLDSCDLLIYRAEIFATEKTLRIPTVLEEDTVRLLLDQFLNELNLIKT
jgi:hypothetical protein